MTLEQIYVLSVLGLMLVLFVWGRWRYDLVALIGLLAVVLGGVVPGNQAFDGFSHPAVVTVAAILVISRAVQGSGIIGLLVRYLEMLNFGPSGQVAAVSTLVALLSGFMNNVGALALLLPVVLQISRNSNRAPGELMMPLAFGSLLGGLTTMIGTPPNIIVASIRHEKLGASFGMFDFTPIGLIVAILGILFISTVGWRLIPIRVSAGKSTENFNIHDYVTEIIVPKKSGLSGTSLQALFEISDEKEIKVAGIIRGNKKIMRPDMDETLRINDHLLIEGKSEFVEKLLNNTPLKLVGNQNLELSALENKHTGVIEVVVKPDSLLNRRSIAQVQLEQRYGVHLLALARHGHPIREQLRKSPIRHGDILLLQADLSTIHETLNTLGCLPLRQRDLSLHREPTFLPIGIFILAIGTSITGVLSTPVALTAAVVSLLLCRQISVIELYKGVDWPIIVLLGAMVPVGFAMEISGVNALLAKNIVLYAVHFPPWGIIAIVLISAMVLSDIINNAATAILMSQLSIKVADQLEMSVDPLLMAVAIGSSCAFLTPIGHQSNILVMGPGGYKFSDYWRMGLPLEILIVVFSVPLISFFWPI